MSKHKRKRRDKYENRYRDNPNINGLQDLLNNVDKDQVYNILNSLNNMTNNNSQQQNDDEYDDYDSYYNNDFNPNNYNGNNNFNPNNLKNANGDYTLQFLNSLRPIIHPSKSGLLNKIIQIYTLSKLMKF
ncbi:hypothetical protein FDF74_10205 [Clostridium niameyense]|uniref:Uncharacterized protein n=1 Tax=Clostridium niameyense TaxID=1622073 RepID=A0A6M0RBK6_9CLOT|nr:hypothetical protein [Clostridium niameyense]NEZ47562.1 hypothetical protein [Clostridium niameyense]